MRFIPEIILLTKFLKKEKFAVVHVNGSYQFKVAIAARLSKTPVVWHLNDTYAPASLKMMFKWVAKYCASGFIVAGARVKDYYLSDSTLKGLPCVEVHAPVNLQVFDPGRFDNQKMQEHRKLYVGTVSGVNPAKGIECFIDVISKVLNSYPDIQFCIAGALLDSQATYYQSILSQIDRLGISHDSIQFLGLVEDIPSFINSLDICLFTSVTEASPTSIWEAMAMEKAVVTTDVGSVTQYVTHGVSGFVADVGDSDALAGHIIELINNEEMRNTFGQNARQVAKERLSIDSAAMLTKEIYSTVAKLI